VKQTLSLKDVGEKGTELRTGMLLSVQFDADFVKIDGAIEMTWFDIGDVYAYYPRLVDSMIKLDQGAFTTRHRLLYEELVELLTNLALIKAERSTDWQDGDEE
jgi:hypothetical protein